MEQHILRDSLKSIITKRWYLVLLIAWISIHAYNNVNSFFSKVYRIEFLIAACCIIVFDALLLYFIIKEHSKLALTIRLYVVLRIVIYVFIIAFAFYYRIKLVEYRKSYSMTKYVSNFIHIIVGIILFIGSKKYITTVPASTDQNLN